MCDRVTHKFAIPALHRLQWHMCPHCHWSFWNPLRLGCRAPNAMDSDLPATAIRNAGDSDDGQVERSLLGSAAGAQFVTIRPPGSPFVYGRGRFNALANL